MDVRNRRRLQAALIAAVFVIPVVVALVLTTTGWIPDSRSYGKPVQPERDLVSVPVQRADGQPFAWRNDDAVWTLVALPGPDCAEHCLRQLDLVHRAQIALGRHADKLRLLYLGVPPEGAVAQGFEEVWMLATTPSHAFGDLRAPARDSVSAVLVTPDGKALTRYAANFDPEGLRQDLKKVVH
jgi:cytochrome oxidase Cu insertion factor (SCO1/SenC/PrrC family)